jgi:two-component system repressor protein LuxO
MQAVYRIIDAAAPSKASVFITGESGTGKEVCAAAIHNQSNRADKPIVALNCGAIPRDLMESEIFGHKKGAFTGAATDREGAALKADGGTLFLDEIGEMDMNLQTKLLRFIQTGRFNKVGSNTEIQVDVRFISATNQDPLVAVAEGRLREDLYYRLHVVPIKMPALNERGDDIMAIGKHFLLSYAEEEGKIFRDFSPEVEFILRRYNWPGNVRQLQNVIRNIVVLHNDEQVQNSHLPSPLDQALGEQVLPLLTASQSQSKNQPVTEQPIRPLATVERETIERAIELCNGNIPKAAGLLDVSPSTIYRKKQAWEGI